MENQSKELDFSALLQTFMKRKKIILSFFFVFLILGAVWFFLAPPKYAGSAVIEVGTINEVLMSGSSDLFSIESPIQVSAKISNGTYGKVEGVTAVNPPDTSLVDISLSGNNYDQVKNNLNNIVSAVLESHNEIANQSDLKEKSILDILSGEKKSIEQDISYLIARGQQVASLMLETRKIELTQTVIQKNFAVKQTKIINGPVVEEKRPSYLVIVFSAFLGIFLGMIFVVFAEKFLL
jgi:uncharacterized protein involved in exopolysaccharide biosynthesis